MKYYKSFMDRQEASPALHEKLQNLEGAKKRSRPWARYGALAACAALIVAAGVWKLPPRPAPVPYSSTGDASSHEEVTYGQPDLTPDTSSIILGDWEYGFVVNSPTEGDKLMFPMIPAIHYQDITDRNEVDAARMYVQGSFTVDLTKADIQAIFWGPEGKPEARHPKLEQGDLPWMLFWDGYFVQGSAWYDGEGQLMEVTLRGEQGQASFTLVLCPGELPFSCTVGLSREDEISEFNGVKVAGWSKIYDRDGEADYICGSEFMTADNIGVRFVNQNSTMQAEYGTEDGILFGNMDLGGAQTFNALFVRQALTGGLYLDHLNTAASVPVWRDELFDSLEQARQEADFAPYLPTSGPEGYGKFFGHLTYQEGRENMFLVSWTRGYDNVIITVYLDHLPSYYRLVDPEKPETYDLRLYPIPWCDSVPEEYRETVEHPVFRAEDMSLEMVESRWNEHDTGGRTYSFSVLHPDGALVSYRCDGLTAEQVWALVEETR